MSRQQANEQDSRRPAPFSHHESRSQDVPPLRSPRAASQMPMLTSASNTHRADRPPAFDLPLPRVSTITQDGFPNYSPTSTTLPSLQRAHTPHYEDESARRRKLPRVDSIVPHQPSLPQVTAEGSNTGSLHSALQRPGTISPSPLTSGPIDQFPRPIITARSPLHRARSFAHLHHLQPPTGTIPADLNPFPNAPSANKYVPESMTSNVTTQPDHQSRSALGLLPMVPQTSGGSLSRASPASSTRSPFFRQLPESAGSTSPSGSYLSSGERDRTSPINSLGPPPTSVPMQPQHDRTSPVNPFRPSPTSMPMQLPEYARTTMDHGHQIKQEQDRPEGTVPISTSGEGGTYKMMNFNTGTGLLAIPVETGAASKASDEKRKRNAGASARFRERRKKREMEASVTIRKLERQVKDLTEDRDFYMRERDYLSAVLSRQPGAERLPPRPQSPRLSRSTPLPIRASELRSFDYDDERSLSPEIKSRHSEEGRRPPPDLRHAQIHLMQPRSPLDVSSFAHSWPAPVQQQQPAPPYHEEVHSSTLAHRGANVIDSRAERAGYHHTGPSHPHPVQFHGPPPTVMQAAPTTGPLNPFQTHGRGQNDLAQYAQPRPRHDQR